MGFLVNERAVQILVKLHMSGANVKLSARRQVPFFHIHAVHTRRPLSPPPFNKENGVRQGRDFTVYRDEVGDGYEHSCAGVRPFADLLA